jgi:hypothetical protein
MKSCRSSSQTIEWGLALLAKLCATILLSLGLWLNSAWEEPLANKEHSSGLLHLRTFFVDCCSWSYRVALVEHKVDDFLTITANFQLGTPNINGKDKTVRWCSSFSWRSVSNVWYPATTGRWKYTLIPWLQYTPKAPEVWKYTLITAHSKHPRRMHHRHSACYTLPLVSTIHANIFQRSEIVQGQGSRMKLTEVLAVFWTCGSICLLSQPLQKGP